MSTLNSHSHAPGEAASVSLCTETAEAIYYWGLGSPCDDNQRNL